MLCYYSVVFKFIIIGHVLHHCTSYYSFLICFIFRFTSRGIVAGASDVHLDCDSSSFTNMGIFQGLLTPKHRLIFNCSFNHYSNLPFEFQGTVLLTQGGDFSGRFVEVDEGSTLIFSGSVYTVSSVTGSFLTVSNVIISGRGCQFRFF